jgi:hypothetical protein
MYHGLTGKSVIYWFCLERLLRRNSRPDLTIPG